MKTRSIFRVLVTVILVAFLASCHKSNTQGKLVPKDAAVVLVIDGKSISSKLSWDDIKQNAAIQKLMLDSSTAASLKSILNNPDSSGIDIKSDIIFFVEKDSAGGGYIAVEGSVKDPALFKSFYHQIDSAGTESQVDDVTFISHYPACTGWNKDKFVVAYDAPSVGNMGDYTRRMMSDSINTVTKRDISATCKSIFALDEKNSLAKNDNFSKLMKENGDMHLWVNSEVLSKGMFTTGPMAMLNMDDFYKDNVTTSTLLFDNGKITFNSKTYMNDKVLEFYKKYIDGKVDEDMLQRMPGKDVDGIMALNFKPEGIKALLTQLNLDGMANGALKQYNLTLDDITNAFKGDILFGVSDVNINVDSATTALPEGDNTNGARSTSTGNYVFAASIGDKDAFNKVFNTGKRLIDENMAGNPGAILPFSFDNNGTYFVVTNTKDNTAKFLARPNPTKFDFISNISDQPAGGYINIQLLLKAFSGVVDKDSTSQALYDASVKMWSNLYVKGGAVDGNVATSYMEINLVDNSTNSLKQLNQYLAKCSVLYKEKKDEMAAKEFEYNNSMKVDSVVSTVAPPVDVPTN